MRLYPFVVVLASVTLACADVYPRLLWSPNQQLKATVETKRPQKGDFFDMIKVENKKGDSIGSFSLEKNESGTARYVYKARWSPDSRFLIFSTLNSGGHSFWHTTTYFFDSKTQKFYELDRFIGLVIEPDFNVSKPDIVETKVSNPKLGVDGDPIPRRVSLAKFMEAKGD
jgi:hypothetical protein